MPDYTWNKLIITCSDDQLKEKIKKVLFKYNQENKPILTMKKLLPIPEGLDENPAYNELGYYWCYAVWGTKWDVDCHEVIESGETLTIYYDTAWNSNLCWFERFCEFVEDLTYAPFEKPKDLIHITLEYVEEYETLGTRIEWVPGKDCSVIEDVQIPYEW